MSVDLAAGAAGLVGSVGMMAFAPGDSTMLGFATGCFATMSGLIAANDMNLLTFRPEADSHE